MDKANILPFARDEVCFGFELGAQLNAHLQQAASLISTKSESLKALLEAYEQSPQQLEVLTALYKFYFYQGELEKAEEIVFQSLIQASIQGGFNHNWESLTPESSNWSELRGPSRTFLYSLKALAFIRLRQEDLRCCKKILEVLQLLDPNDQIGAEVIRSLYLGIKG